MRRDLSIFEPPPPCHHQLVFPIMAAFALEDQYCCNNAYGNSMNAKQFISTRNTNHPSSYYSALALFQLIFSDASASTWPLILLDLCRISPSSSDQDTNAEPVTGHTYVVYVWQLPSQYTLFVRNTSFVRRPSCSANESCLIQVG